MALVSLLDSLEMVAKMFNLSRGGLAVHRIGPQITMLSECLKQVFSSKEGLFVNLVVSKKQFNNFQGIHNSEKQNNTSQIIC